MVLTPGTQIGARVTTGNNTKESEVSSSKEKTGVNVPKGVPSLLQVRISSQKYHVIARIYFPSFALRP